MSKRTDGKYERRDRDFYATPPEPIYKLLPHIQDCRVFAEPMCGDGAIVRVLEARGWVCGAAMDMEPQDDMIARAVVSDVMDLTAEDFAGCDHIISNPPWPAKHKRGDPTVSIVKHLSAILPTWFLMSADFMHNEYAAPLLEFCTQIISVGRVKWIADSDNTGFDNAAWYKFDQRREGPPILTGYTKPLKTFHPDVESVL
jgi:hypothetical protein